jgi:RNA polymerase sigma-70 factor (ECF subfamily)
MMSKPFHNEDYLLAQKIAKGDSRAFDSFYEIYFDRLYRFIKKRLGDDDSVQDVLQNTLISALKEMGNYRGEAQLITWLCQIARSQLSKHFKKNPKLKSETLALLQDTQIREAIETMEAPTEFMPDTRSEREELIQLITLTLDYLPGRYGDILEWKYVQGWSVKQIAEELGQSFESVQSMLQRARKAFREIFDNANDVLSGGI